MAMSPLEIIKDCVKVTKEFTMKNFTLSLSTVQGSFFLVTSPVATP